MNKILIVDDEQSMRDFLAILLKKDGHEVVTAANGTRRLMRFKQKFLIS